MIPDNELSVDGGGGGGRRSAMNGAGEIMAGECEYLVIILYILHCELRSC